MQELHVDALWMYCHSFERANHPSLDDLAVLTTSRIPPMEQGLLPVLNLRFPVIYLPTMEPILFEVC